MQECEIQVFRLSAPVPQRAVITLEPTEHTGGGFPDFCRGALSSFKTNTVPLPPCLCEQTSYPIYFLAYSEKKDLLSILPEGLLSFALVL